MRRWILNGLLFLVLKKWSFIRLDDLEKINPLVGFSFSYFYNVGKTHHKIAIIN